MKEVPEHRDSHASSSHELPSEPQRKVVPGKHSIYTHFPKNRNCDICQKTKITRAPWWRRTGEAVPRAANLVIDNSRSQSSQWRLWISKQSTICSRGARLGYPMDPVVSVQNKNFTGNPERSLQKFLEPTRKPKVICTDNSLEFGKACEDVSWNHCRSTPHRAETNGIVESVVRRIGEGASAVLLQSGLNENWWADSMEGKIYLRNVQDLLSDGENTVRRAFLRTF